MLGGASYDRLAELAASVLSQEFLDAGPAYDSLEEIHAGHIDEWTESLRGTGLFTVAEVDGLARCWRAHPRSLLDVLLADADEVTARRCALSWTALVRVAALGPLPSAMR
ncbi:hypothetical protein DW322_17580 [Rhodococcus rhodnii]|uniref:Uncharacterized protein n=2 Tax=Rhodococcus rhodnii TaxID=38312 RepID=A0A6P2CJK9_9NOCA|nr:hypothetical protein DW322_17580 [Rhodococcus rhodnii]